jgi:UDP-N-acetylglucosamine 2-epimerase
VQALNSVQEPIVFPAHPRTKQALSRLQARFESHVRLIDPIGYFDMVRLEDHARLIATDSGGVQREAYFLGIPCLTMRDETEWTETLEVGWNRLVGADPEQIVDAWFNFKPPPDHPPIFGDGKAGEAIVQVLESIDITYGLPRAKVGRLDLVEYEVEMEMNI